MFVVCQVHTLRSYHHYYYHSRVTDEEIGGPSLRSLVGLVNEPWRSDPGVPVLKLRRKKKKKIKNKQTTHKLGMQGFRELD